MVRTLLTAARLILYHYLWKRESSLKCSIPSMSPPLNNTSCICHDSRHVYNKPSNMRNISKYFQCLSIYKIDKFTNIHIHNTIGHSLLYQFHPMASFGGLFASSVPPAFLRYVFFLYHVLK